MPRKHSDCLNDPKCSTRRVQTRCTVCRKRHADYMREYTRKNAARINAWRKRSGQWIRGKYGISIQEKHELFESSDGFCALCYETPATVIDHDHATGKIRGALCHFCNKGLGYIEKMGATSTSIIEYMTTEWSAA